MTSRGHQRSNPVYLHILKSPLGYVLQVVEISCFYHKMHNRFPYLLYYSSVSDCEQSLCYTGVLNHVNISMIQKINFYPPALHVSVIQKINMFLVTP